MSSTLHYEVSTETRKSGAGRLRTSTQPRFSAGRSDFSATARKFAALRANPL